MLSRSALLRGAARLAVASKLVGIVVALSLLCVIAAGYSGLQKLKVGGPVYDQVVLGKDLIADILPPPEYIIEAFLETNLALSNLGDLAQHKERFEALRKDFDVRHDYWLKQTFDDAIKSKLTESSYAPAMEFWRIAETEFFPALERGDQSAAHRQFLRLHDAYNEHRKQIDAVVEQATAMNAAVEASANDQITEVLIYTGLASLIMLALIVGASVALHVRVIVPVSALRARMMELAGGMLDVDIPFRQRFDEIGEMARTVEIFRQHAADRERLTADIEESRKQADSRRIELEGLAKAFLSKADTLKAVMDRQAHVVQSAAKRLEDAAAATATQAGEGLSSSSDASRSVQTVAAAAEQLSASTKSVAVQADNAEKLTAVAATKALHANEDIRTLSEVTGKINDILDVIGGIAAQTNLLSLNATIEAARAGEAGKGFAVVAGEVKMLAAQTSKATSEVAKLVTSIKASTETAVASIKHIADQVDEVSTLNRAMAMAVSEQQSATQEIAESATRAAQSTDSAKANSEKVVHVVQQTRANVDSVEAAATALFGSLHEFTSGLDDFLGSISSDFRDRRRSIRHHVTHQVKVRAGGKALAAELAEISLTGASFSSNPGFKAGAVVELDFGAKAISGSIKWATESAFGVEFGEAVKELPVVLDLIAA